MFNDMWSYATGFDVLGWATGLWTMIWKMGITAVAIAGLIAFELMAPAWFLPGLRRIALWVAVVLGYGLIAYGVGVKDENARWYKWYDSAVKAEAKNGEKARSDAERVVRAEPPDSVRNDPRNRDNRKK